jgi:hypothetical protein
MLGTMFKVRRQLAHHMTDEFDIVGECSESEVFDAFDQFPWKSKCDRALGTTSASLSARIRELRHAALAMVRLALPK